MQDESQLLGAEGSVGTKDGNIFKQPCLIHNSVERDASMEKSKNR